MPLSDELKAEISRHANLRDWFAYKDRIMGSSLSTDLKREIIGFGLRLMLIRFSNILP